MQAFFQVGQGVDAEGHERYQLQQVHAGGGEVEDGDEFADFQNAGEAVRGDGVGQ